MADTDPYGIAAEEPNQGTTYFFNADAQAILEEAPNLETGLTLLGEAYKAKNWDDKQGAANIASDYAQQLRYRFEDQSALNENEIQVAAPIGLDELKTDSGNVLESIDEWEAKNKEFLATATDADQLLIKEKLLPSIEKYASDLRRESKGKDNYWLTDKFYRFGVGLTGGILKAVGAKETLKALEEETDPDRDSDFSSDLASGAGLVGGIMGAAAIPGVGPAIAGGYMLGTAAGEVREIYEQSRAQVGDKQKAFNAAAIELGSQVVMTGVGGKIYADTGRALAKSIFGKEVKALTSGNAAHVAGKAVELGVIGGVGNTLSNVATQYGTNQDISPFDNLERAVAVQAIFGTAVGGLDILARKRALGGAQAASKEDIPELGTPGDPPPAETSISRGVKENVIEVNPEGVTSINAEKVTPDTITTKAKISPNPDETGYDFVSADGARYSFNKEGATQKENIESGEVSQPFDKTFFVKPEIAAKIAGLKDGTDPSGEAVRVVTDLKGLYLKSGHIDDNLNISPAPTGARLVEVPVEDGPGVGLIPVQVNRPRNVNGHNRVYRSEIGRPITSINPKSIVSEGSTVGAAFDPSKERALGERLRSTPGVAPEIQALFGTGPGPNNYGYDRYMPKSNVESIDIAERFIAERGQQGAIDYIVDSPSNVVDAETIAIGNLIIDRFNVGIKAANVAGDTQAIVDMALQIDRMGYALSKKKTNAAQATQIGRMLNKLDPEFHVAKVRQELTKAAVTEASQELKISPEEVLRNDTEINNADAQIKQAQAVIDTEGQHLSKQFDPEIQEVTKLIGEVDKAKTELDTQAKVIEDAATEANKGKIEEIDAGLESAKKQIDEMQSKADKKVEEVKAKQEEIKNAVTESEAKIKELESKGEERAVKEAETKVTQAENAVQKLKDNQAKGSKVKPESVAKAEEGLKQLKSKKPTAEDGLTSEEKKALHRLKSAAEAAKKKAAEIQVPKQEDLLTEGEKKKIESLTKLLQSGEAKKVELKTASLSSSDQKKISRLRILSAKEETKKTDLAKVRDDLRNKKAVAQKNGDGTKSALAESQRKRIQELTAKKKVLSERKKSIDKKVSEKIKEFLPAEKKLKDLFAAAKVSTGSTQKKLLKKAYDLKDKLLKKAPEANDHLYSYFQANLLSDPSTQIVNILGNATQIIASTLSYAITGLPRGNLDAGVFLGGIIKGMTGEGFRAFVAEMRGIKTYKPEIAKYQDNAKGLSRPGEEHGDFVKDAPSWVKKVGINNLGYVFRALSAVDATFYRGLKEGQARMIAHNEGKALKVDNLKTYVAEKLFNSTEAWNSAHRIAESEMKLLNENGIKTTPRETDLRTWELLDEKRAPNIREESHRFAQKSTFTNLPDGKVGAIINAFSKFTNAKVHAAGKDIRPLRYLLPFLNTAGNILNANLDLTPIGLVRGVEKFNPTKSALERRNAMGKFLLGTIGTGVVYGIAKEFMDDKDPAFAVYGAGPTNPAIKRQWMAQGGRPYSVKVGDTYVRYAETPIGLMLGFLGSWMDQQRYSPAYERKQGSAAVAAIVSGMAGAFTDNSFLKNVGDLVDIARGDKSKDIRNIITNTTRGFVPASGALRAITKIFQDPIETYDDMWSKFVSGIPGVQSIGTHPALNSFGEPVERTFEDRVSALGRFYSQRTTDPTWRWLAETGYHVPEQSGLTVELSKVENPKATARRSQTLGAAYADVLTPEERYEFISKSGLKIKDVVNKYRQRYGQSGYREEVQKELGDEISDIRSQVKRDMFLR